MNVDPLLILPILFRVFVVWDQMSQKLKTTIMKWKKWSNAIPLYNNILISRIFLILPPTGFLVPSDHDGPDWHEGGGVGAAGADQARLGAAAAGAHQDPQEEEWPGTQEVHRWVSIEAFSIGENFY